MGNCDRLIQFIDRHTNCGTEELPQIFGEGVGVEDPGGEYLDRFLDRDWLQLQNYWQSQSDLWIEALILLLGDIDPAKSRDIFIEIVLLGSDESALNAIEYVRDFIQELHPEVREQINTKISAIVSKRF
jgi:hypothetical protein